MKFLSTVVCLGAALILFVAPLGWASRADCGDLPNVPPKPAEKVAAEDVAVPNDYDQVVEEDTRDGVVYLALFNGDTPTANACGLIPSNDPAEWTGSGAALWMAIT